MLNTILTTFLVAKVTEVGVDGSVVTNMTKSTTNANSDNPLILFDARGKLLAGGHLGKVAKLTVS